jgi:CheY-specific phosphatase CheX
MILGKPARNSESTDYWDIILEKITGTEAYVFKKSKAKIDLTVPAVPDGNYYGLEKKKDLITGRISTRVSLQEFKLPSDIELLIKQYGRVRSNTINVV